MIIIRKVHKEDKEIINSVVDIHLSTFQGFFLTFMGKGFLRQMYSSYCMHEDSGLLAAIDDQGNAVGFLAYSCDMSALYKFMIKKKLVFFAWYSAGAFLRNPASLLRILGAFLKPGESKREEAYVELASIGVSPEAKQNGVGTQMISSLKEMVDFSRFSYITLETDAVNNDGANRFYQKNGFVLHRSYETHEGRKMNEYRYRS